MEFNIKKNIALNTVASSIYLFCNWVITVLVVTLSSNYEASGSLAVSMAVGNIFATIMLFRVRIIQVSDVENKCSSGDYITHRGATFLFATVFCVVYSFFTVDRADYLPVFAFLCFKAIESFVDVYHGIDQKFDRFDLIGISQIARGLLLVLSFSLGMILFQNLSTAFFLMAITTGLFVVFFDVRKTSKLDSIQLRLNKSSMHYLFTCSIFGFLGSLFATMIVSLPRQIFALQFGNEALGIYAALATPTVLVQAFVSYIYAPLIGPLSHDWHNKRFSAIQRRIVQMVALVICIIFCLAVLFYFFGVELFNFIFQKDVQSYMFLIYPLLISTGAAVVVSFISDLLVIAKNYVGVLCSNGIGLLVDIVATPSLISLFGANGISFSIIAGFFSAIIVASLFYVRSWKKHKCSDA